MGQERRVRNNGIKADRFHFSHVSPSPILGTGCRMGTVRHKVKHFKRAFGQEQLFLLDLLRNVRTEAPKNKRKMKK